MGYLAGLIARSVIPFIHTPLKLTIMKELIKKSCTALFLILFVFCMAGSTVGQNDQNKVNEAYQLRMQGKPDSAKTILESLVEEDPTNALAWFELARTLDHIKGGNPQKMMETKPTKDCLDKAIVNNPENGVYAYAMAKHETLNFYIALMMEKQKEEVIEKLNEVEELYKQAAQKDQAFNVGKLTLVEFYGGLPAEMGGDKAKAEKYAQEVARYDDFLGAVGKEILLPEEEDRVEFWTEVKTKHPDDPRVYEALGRACLWAENTERALVNFEKATELDNEYKWLYLELGRYYTMQMMQNFEKKDEYVPMVEKYFNHYLAECPEAPNLVKAWTYGSLARIKMQSGQAEEGQKLLAKANELDAYFPKIFGLPAMDAPPGKVKDNLRHSYYFRPF